MMNTLKFPEPFQHAHHAIVDINAMLERKRTLSQRAADRVASTFGSWKFLIIQSGMLAVWFALNTTGWLFHWDPYPFIFMNLILSLQAAYTASVVMISENRQAERDRLQARNDFEVNQKAEEEIRVVLEHLTSQNLALLRIHEELLDLKEGLLQKSN